MERHSFPAPVRVALPKGRFMEVSRRVLNSLGIRGNASRLSFETPDAKFQLFMAKPRDIPWLVHDGLVDVGLAPDEWIVEENLRRSAATAEDASTTRVFPALQLGIRISALRSLEIDTSSVRRIVTEFPSIASSFFADHRKRVQILHVHGSSEAFVPGIADACVACVETGTTARINNLSEVVTIYDDLGMSTVSRARQFDATAEAISAAVIAEKWGDKSGDGRPYQPA